MKNISFFLNNKLGGDYITFHYRYRKQIIIGIVLLILVGTISTYIIFNYNQNKKDIVEEDKPIEKSKTGEKGREEEKIYVDIKGEVNSPGIYLVQTNSRIIDVIDRAGGLTANANTSVINLSKKVKDEMVIIIYSNDQVNTFYETKQIEKDIIEKCIKKDNDSLHNDACIESNNEQSSKVNINMATKEELMNLPSIGESKAKDIITYRETNGPFSTIEDIKKVSGIGDNIYSQIKEIITV